MIGCLSKENSCQGVSLGYISDERVGEVDEHVRMVADPEAQENGRDDNANNKINGEDLVLESSELLPRWTSWSVWVMNNIN